MRCSVRVVTVAALAVLAAGVSRVHAQSAADFAQTAAYAVAHQNADGGFASEPGTALDAGGHEHWATRARLRRRIRARRAGLHPVCQLVQGARGRLCTTARRQARRGHDGALGLMAAAELKTADKTMIDDAIGYFGANAKAFEEVRMAIAGLEAVERPLVGLRTLGLDQLEAVSSP